MGTLTFFEAVKRILVAYVLGGLIGYEREKINRPAGLRTHMIVAVGACLVMLVGQSIGASDVDPTRIAAQVVSGIGFLGAGTILRYGSSVKGLTTAATLWGVGCIGIAIGAGFCGISIFTGLLLYVTLIFIPKIEIIYMNKKIIFQVCKTLDNTVESVDEIINKLKTQNINIDDIEIDMNEHGEKIMTLTLHASGKVEKGKLIQRIDDIFK